MEKLLQLTAAGIAVGGIYATAALGFVLIYKATRVLNFAQGALMMLGGYAAFAAATMWSLPLALAILAGTAITAATGGVMYMSSLGPVQRRGGNTEFAQVIMTMAWSLIIIAVIHVVFGPMVKQFPNFLPDGTFTLAGARIPFADVGAIAITACVIVVFTLIFSRTRFGLVMRGLSDNRQAAVMLGANERWVSAAAWALASSAAAVAGVTLAAYVPLSLSFADVALLAFPAVVLGGIDSIPGGLLGGVIIGLVQQYSSGYIDPGFGMTSGFIIMLVVLLVRPQGLFGSKEVIRL